MEFTCPRVRLHEALSILGSIVPARSTKPVLQNIHIKGTEKNTLEISATDYDVGVKYELQVDDLKDPEDVLLPCARMISIVRDAWGDNITCKIKNNKANIITENARFDIIGESSDDFPAIPDMEEDEAVDIMAEDIAKSISMTIFATAKEEERYSLAGVNVCLNGSKMEIVTTDTFRLALSSCSLREKTEENKNAIVLVKGMNELQKLIVGEELVKIKITDTHIFAKTSRATMMSRLIEGKFPQYNNVIPKELDKKIKVKKDRFIQALRQAANMSNEETRAVNIVAHDSVIELKSASVTGGEAEIKVDAEIEGGEVSISFNYTYLLDVLKVLDEENFTLQLKDKDTPAKIEEKNYTYVVSPVCPRTGA
jgi:DNA polymerase-3 subunit beta